MSVNGECISAGNGGSLDKCRRRWDLADAENLKYKFMQVGLPLLSAAATRYRHLSKPMLVSLHQP